jgi:hypothetical protein
MPEETKGKATPPYLPYKTLISSLENLGQGVPPKIDRSIWKNQPGSVQSQILSAYKFLGLIDDLTNPTPTLKKLVEHRASPASVLKPLVEERFSDVLKHDLATMTTAMLNSEFETVYGVEGDVKKKATRFFLQAAKANGMTLSKFLLDQTRASSGPRKKRAKRADDTDDTDDVLDDDSVSSKGTSKAINLRSGGGQLTISLSVDLFELSKPDRDFVFGLIDSLRDYESKPTVRITVHSKEEPQ